MNYSTVIKDFTKLGYSILDVPAANKSLVKELYQQNKLFFNLPEEKKLALRVGSRPFHRGYVPFSEQGKYTDEDIRNYEALDLIHLNTAQIKPKNDSVFYGENLWPDFDSFKNIIQEYLSLMADISQKIFQEFALFCKQDKFYFEEKITAPLSQLRLLHYVVNNEPIGENSNNMGSHTDYECFSILLQNTEGMQFVNKSRVWQNAPNTPFQWIIFPSDLIEIMSNGKIESLQHRVTNTRQDRLSIPFFANLNENYVVEPFEHFGEKKYDPLTPGEHLFNNMLLDFPYLQKRFDQIHLSSLPKRFYEKYPRELSIRS